MIVDDVDDGDHIIKNDNNEDDDEVMVVKVENEWSQNFNSLNGNGYVKL